MSLKLNKPLVSIVLITYNQECYVAEALKSLLGQDYENLEIVISDDCSSDATYNVLIDTLREYQGGKKVIINKNSQNLGIVGNLTKAFQLTGGDLIFMAAGDDVSIFNRCTLSVSKWLEGGMKYDLIASDAYDMLENGHVLGVKETENLEDWSIERWVSKRPFFYGASFMMTRRLFSLNVLNTKLQYEDQCLVFRAVMLGTACRLRLPLIKHRRGGISQQGVNLTISKISRKHKILMGSLNAINEVNQMISDSNKIFMDSKVEIALRGRLRINLYASEILSEMFLIEKFKVFFKYSDVDIFKRLRFLKYALAS